MTYDTDLCGNIGLLEQMESNFSVFPIPAKNEIYAQINGLNIKSYTLTNSSGQILINATNTDTPVVMINTSALSSGTYILTVLTDKGVLDKKVSIE